MQRNVYIPVTSLSFFTQNTVRKRTAHTSHYTCRCWTTAVLDTLVLVQYLPTHRIPTTGPGNSERTCLPIKNLDGFLPVHPNRRRRIPSEPQSRGALLQATFPLTRIVDNKMSRPNQFPSPSDARRRKHAWKTHKNGMICRVKSDILVPHQKTLRRF